MKVSSSSHALEDRRKVGLYVIYMEVVAAGRGHLQRPLGGLLALDVGEVGARCPVLDRARRRRREDLAALEVT